MPRPTKGQATNPPAANLTDISSPIAADPAIMQAGVTAAAAAVEQADDPAAREAAALGEDDEDEEDPAAGASSPPAQDPPAAAPPAAAPAAGGGKTEKKPAGQAKPRQTKTAKPRTSKSDAAPPPAAPASPAPSPVLPSSGHFRQVHRPGRTAPSAAAEPAAPRAPKTLQTLRPPVVPPPTPAGQPEPIAQEVLVRIPPLYELPSRAYCAPHIELRMSPEQARMARRLAFGMECENEGRQKCSPAAAVLDLLQQLVDAEKDATRRRPAAA